MLVTHKSPLLVSEWDHQMFAAVLVVEDKCFKYRPSICPVAELSNSNPDISLQIVREAKGNHMKGWDCIAAWIYLGKQSWCIKSFIILN